MNYKTAKKNFKDFDFLHDLIHNVCTQCHLISFVCNFEAKNFVKFDIFFPMRQNWSKSLCKPLFS